MGHMLALYTEREMWKMEAVKCQDVRRALSPFVDGQLALTEWAMIQGHLAGCAGCRNEVDRQRGLAGLRARASHRRTTIVTLTAMAVVLGVAAGGGFVIYQGGTGELPSWQSPAPPRTVAPPVLVPAPRPSPSAPTRAKGSAETAPWATAPPEPAARVTRPAATVEAPIEDRMPTQGRPAPVLSAPPGAEAMPTQGPARSPGRP